MKRILRKIKRNKEEGLTIRLTDSMIGMKGTASIKRLKALRKAIDEVIDNLEQEQLEEKER